MRNAVAYSMLAAALLAGPSLAGKENLTPSNADRIHVIAHIPLAGEPVVQLTSGVHWRRSYLYLVHGSGAPVTILDVTDPAKPKETGKLDVPEQEANGTMTAAVGTEVLLTSSVSTPTPQTVTIVNFADQAHPRVVQQFSGVTSVLKDRSRGIIYLTNPEGLWVLRLDPATDMELQKEYEKYVLYNR
jgi:hypothetical protein